MSQIIPIYIPTFISDQNYNPSRVLPHIYFYNGLIDCETYWIESGSAAFGGVTYQQNAFPYFDNYNVVSGSFPTVNSESLLFNNENASYGQIPTENLYTQYWETYVSLLYNPKTRLLNCEAIIPLADYFKMELNDVVNFKGNYYHLRAINEYSLKTGECVLQLLGPIIRDTLSDLQPIPPPPPPNYVTGSSLIYDFGYVNSYPGTGTTVYDVSGNGITGSLINSPTYSSVKSGSLSFNKASSQRIEYSGSFPQAYTVQAFFELSGSNNLYPGIGGQFNNNGMVLAIDTQYPPSPNGGTYQVYYYGASGNTSSGAKNNASAGTNINNNFIMYSATNDGTNTVEYYINTGSVSTQSNGFNRTLFTPTNQVAYIGYDPDGAQYINGKLVAWLVYPFVLTGAQITQNYNIFNAR